MTVPIDRPGRTALLVVGSHRSGTSAMARTLALAGLGDLPTDLLPPHPTSNATGFWESRSVVHANDDMLSRCGGSWNAPPAARPVSEHDVAVIVRLIRDRFQDADRIVVKDPRVSLLLPTWRVALTRLGYRITYVLMLRDPREVAASLSKRNGMARSDALALWATYQQRAEYDSRCHARVIVPYERLLENWRAVVADVACASGFAASTEVDPYAAEIDAFLDPDLRHCRSAEIDRSADDAHAMVLYARLAADATMPRRESIEQKLQIGPAARPVVAPYVIGTKLSLSRVTADPYLDGFGEPETWGRWSGPGWAHIRLPLDCSYDLMRVEIGIMGVDTPDGGGRYAVVKCGEAEAELLPLRPGKSRIVLLGDMVQTPRPPCILISLAIAPLPHERPHFADDRGAAIGWLRVTSAT